MDIEPTIVLVSPRVEMTEQELGSLTGLDLSGKHLRTFIRNRLTLVRQWHTVPTI